MDDLEAFICDSRGMLRRYPYPSGAQYSAQWWKTPQEDLQSDGFIREGNVMVENYLLPHDWTLSRLGNCRVGSLKEIVQGLFERDMS